MGKKQKLIIPPHFTYKSPRSQLLDANPHLPRTGPNSPRIMGDELRAHLRERSLANGSRPPSRKGAIPWNKGLTAAHPMVKGPADAAHKAWREKYNTRKKRHQHAVMALKGNKSKVSKLETKFLNYLEKELGVPVLRQYHVEGLGIVDGVIEDGVRFGSGTITKPVAIEVDGTYWHQDPEKDKRRTRRLRARGFAVVRAREKLIKSHPELILDEVRSLLRRRF